MNFSNPPIELQINGEAHVIPDGQPLTELVANLGLPPQAALVEHNGRALLREEWTRVSLAAGDRLEILRVVAGG